MNHTKNGVRLIFLLLIFIIRLNSIAQDTISRNVIYGEVLGNCASISINYEIEIKPTSKFFFCGGVGVIPSGIYFSFDPIFGISMSMNKLLGTKKHYIELGAGFTYHKGMKTVSFNSETNYSKSLFLVTRIGYRYQKSGSGFFWKVGLTPFFSIKHFSNIITPDIVPLLGVAFGRSF